MEIKRKAEMSMRDNVPVRLIVTTFCFGLFLFLSFLINTERAVWFDQWLVDFSGIHITGSTYNILAFYTKLGTREIVIMIAVLSLIFVWWKTKDYLAMVTIAIVLYGSDQLYKSLKDVFQRERPFYDPAIDAIGYSFPSGHATTSMAFYGILIYFLLRYMKKTRMKTITITFLCCHLGVMGISRVFLKVHYLSDVVAGFLIAFVYLILCIYIYEFISTLLSKKIKKKSELTM